MIVRYLTIIDHLLRFNTFVDYGFNLVPSSHRHTSFPFNRFTAILETYFQISIILSAFSRLLLAGCLPA